MGVGRCQVRQGGRRCDLQKVVLTADSLLLLLLLLRGPAFRVLVCFLLWNNLWTYKSNLQESRF